MYANGRLVKFWRFLGDPDVVQDIGRAWGDIRPLNFAAQRDDVAEGDVFLVVRIWRRILGVEVGCPFIHNSRRISELHPRSRRGVAQNVVHFRDIVGYAQPCWCRNWSPQTRKPASDTLGPEGFHRPRRF